jgi:hypothetical protein
MPIHCMEETRMTNVKDAAATRLVDRMEPRSNH